MSSCMQGCLATRAVPAPSWWPHPYRVLSQGGLLVADNALSHPEEIAPLRELLLREPRLTCTTINVGKGELVALRR
ncbi:hypothetical protein [Nonomuraea sp. NPDC005650]|uniref:hypothetical protein n=1 Tax=Nonomuraea sp. NPDC005650 TaxID=3157045 RepID=UPI0033A1FFBB